MSSHLLCVPVACGMGLVVVYIVVYRRFLTGTTIKKV